MLSTDLRDTDIANALASEYGHKIDIVPVKDSDFKNEVADATLKFLAPTPEGEDGFLLVSGTGNPQLVSRAVSNILDAGDRLSVQTAAPILPAIVTGQAGGRSFALWPLKRPFDTSNRLMRRMRQRLYAGRITRWAEAVCRETLNSANSGEVSQDLQVICEDTAFPDDMRCEAEQAIARLHSGQWRPKHCMQHGDFWSENILLAEPGEGAPFYVIDWAGMQAEGYPFFDLSRMLTSLRCGAGFKRRSIERLRQDVGCNRQDMVAYILCGYGQIGKNLEHFPPERYRAAALHMYRFIGQI